MPWCLWSFTRSGLWLEWVHQEPSRTDVSRKWATSVAFPVSSHSWTRDNTRSVLPGALLSGPKSSFQMKVNLAFNLEIKVPESGGRVWSFHSQWWIWGAMSSAGVGPLCFIKSRVNAAVYQEILEHFMLPSADKLYGDADFLFQQHLAPAHSAKTTSNSFADRGITVLDWPANSPDLNPTDSRGRWQTPDPTLQTSWRLLSK